VVGAVFGLKPSRYQSGESERTGRISRCGDEIMRMMLYEAAQSMLALNSAGACAVPNHGRSSRRCGLGSRRSWVAFLAQRPRRRDPLHPLPLAGALSFLG
jgi:transposase